MSLEAFVRAAGGVMGSARDGFGAGGELAPERSSTPAPVEPVTGSGAAVDAHQQRSRQLDARVDALAAHDATADAQLAAATAGSQTGRARMDTVIAAATADVQALGVSTNTPAGKKALVAAIQERLEETKATVDAGGADAQTRAAAAEATATGYDGIGRGDDGKPEVKPMGFGRGPAPSAPPPPTPDPVQPSWQGQPQIGPFPVPPEVYAAADKDRLALLDSISRAIQADRDTRLEQLIREVTTHQCTTHDFVRALAELAGAGAAGVAGVAGAPETGGVSLYAGIAAAVISGGLGLDDLAQCLP